MNMNCLLNTIIILKWYVERIKDSKIWAKTSLCLDPIYIQSNCTCISVVEAGKCDHFWIQKFFSEQGFRSSGAFLDPVQLKMAVNQLIVVLSIYQSATAVLSVPSDLPAIWVSQPFRVCCPASLSVESGVYHSLTLRPPTPDMNMENKTYVQQNLSAGFVQDKWRLDNIWENFTAFLIRSDSQRMTLWSLLNLNTDMKVERTTVVKGSESLISFTSKLQLLESAVTDEFYPWKYKNFVIRKSVLS